MTNNKMLEEAKNNLKQLGLTVNYDYGQHFCIDKEVLEILIRTAQIKSKDTILEIGPGIGALTERLSRTKAKIIAVEIDPRFKGILNKHEPKVKIIYADALKVITELKFNKIISNLPYQISEPLLHHLCWNKQWNMAVLTVPKLFALKIQKNPLFSSFLNIEIINEVPRNSFFPPPRVDSAIIKITPNQSDEEDVFIRRKLYLQRDKKLKNGLMESIIDLYELKHKEKLSKKKAKEIMAKLFIDQTLLNKIIANIPVEQYKDIAGKVALHEEFLEK